MNKTLSVYAGPKACSMIQERGLRPEDVQVVLGAAGGPKWLCLDGIDRAIFSTWFRDRTEKLPLIGASAGAWRFAAIAQGTDMKAYERFRHAYIHQSYVNKMPSAREVSMEGSKILDAYLDKDGEAAVFSHPFFRLNMVASRCRWPLSIEKRPAQMCAMLGAASINALHRNALGIAVSRTLFYDHRDTPPPMNADAFSTARVALDASNIRSATLASGSIPVVMEGVRDIPGAKPGMYRDGGLCDYHMDLPLKADRIILFPHYVDRLVPGWFDKHLFWRHSSAAYLDWVVLLCPSHSFIRGLYYKKIPDRDDFKQLENNDRIDFWNNTVEQSARLGEEFLENIEKDGLRQKVRPLSSLPNF